MAHFDLITSIQNMINKTPIDWHWHHMMGHQDEMTDQLDKWAEWNIPMDMEAKAFWSMLHEKGFMHSSQYLLGEGWTVWIDQIKLTSLNQSHFNNHTQSQYSTTYWQQANKLGTQMEMIDWNSIGTVHSGMTTRWQIWMTKWATGWLPTGKNMKKWNQWPKDQCPGCNVQNTCKTVEHLLLCNHPQPQPLIYQHILWRTEELLDLIAMGLPVQEFLMAMFLIPYCKKLSDHLHHAFTLQQTLGPKWTAQGCISKQWELLGPPSIKQKSVETKVAYL